MAKITRKAAKIFGSIAGTNQIASPFGSLAAGTPMRTNGAGADPDVIQSLANYTEGWFNAVLGANSPAIEDMNSLCFLFAYQIAYLLQEGVAEWNSATAYFIGSIANDGTGKLYSSIQDNNTNHALTDGAWWTALGGGGISNGIILVNSSTTLSGAANNTLVECDTSGGAFTLTLSASPAAGFQATLKDIKGTFSTNPLTIDPNGKTLEGLTSTYVVYADWWNATIYYDGTKYYFVN